MMNRVHNEISDALCWNSYETVVWASYMLRRFYEYFLLFVFKHALQQIKY